MKDRNDWKLGRGAGEPFSGRKNLMEAVVKAGTKEELCAILNAGGVYGFSEELLDIACYNLSLLQGWDTVWELLQGKDFDGCHARLAAHGIDLTREKLDLIHEVIAVGCDEALIAEMKKASEFDEVMDVLRQHGFHAVTDDFLLQALEHGAQLYEEGLLTADEIQELSGVPFCSRCRKFTDLIFARSVVTGLASGVGGAADPAQLLVIACGISLIYTGNA